MSRKQKRTLIRILASLALLVTVALLPLEGWPRLAVFLVPYALIGWDVLWRQSARYSAGRCWTRTS